VQPKHSFRACIFQGQKVKTGRFSGKQLLIRGGRSYAGRVQPKTDTAGQPQLQSSALLVTIWGCGRRRSAEGPQSAERGEVRGNREARLLKKGGFRFKARSVTARQSLSSPPPQLA
jgi:hypothetical protein